MININKKYMIIIKNNVIKYKKVKKMRLHN